MRYATLTLLGFRVDFFEINIKGRFKSWRSKHIKRNSQLYFASAMHIAFVLVKFGLTELSKAIKDSERAFYILLSVLRIKHHPPTLTYVA